jgi:deoxycytidylate deaminase
MNKMRYITDENEIKEVDKFMKVAAEEAEKSGCKKSKRGSLVVKDGKIIGRGYVKPTIEKLCDPCIRENIHTNGQAELCCALHAEWVALLDALKAGNSLEGATLYHIKVKNGEIRPAKSLSCTICSRLILESGIKEFILLFEDGYRAYTAEEANKLSFDYFLRK